MSQRIITSCEIKFNQKEKCYVITTTHKEGAWEGSQTGARVHIIDKYLVHTAWGNGKPIAVYKDVDEMMSFLESAFNVTPVLK